MPHADDQFEDASLFSGFLPGILRTAQLFDWIVTQPLDVRELFNADRTDIALARVLKFTAPHIFPIQLSSFAAVVKASPYVFNCVVSTDDLADAVSGAIGTATSPWMHVGESIDSEVIGDSQFAAYVRFVIAGLEDSAWVRLLRTVSSEQVRTLEVVESLFPTYLHNVTSPNEVAQRAMRVRFSEANPLTLQPLARYQRAIVQSVRALATFRRKTLSRYRSISSAISLTVALDSLMWHVAKADLQGQLAKRGVGRFDRSVICACVRRSGFVATVPNDPVFRNHGLSSSVLAVLNERAREAAAFTSGLTVHSSTQLVPVLRINPGVNTLRGKLDDVSSCARGNGPHAKFKLNKIARRLMADVTVMAGIEAIRELRGAADRVTDMTLVTDFPLEWLLLDGVPLCMRHNTSRIPATPGNLMFGQCAKAEEIYLSVARLRNVLVVRCYRTGDRVSKHLEWAVNQRLNEELGSSDVPSVHFVDVSSREEMLTAFEEFDGGLVVFDGHGYFDSSNGLGSIVVGESPLDVWELRGQLKCPPIVILSACDTLPLGGAHGSSAAAFLALGAVTVLSTLLPVDSVRAGSFLARLLLRIQKFVPILLTRDSDGVSWRSVMCGMLRMAYVSELLEFFQRRFPALTNEATMTLRVATNCDVNVGNPRWHDKLLRRVSALANEPVRRVERGLGEFCYIQDALRYVQIGRPDLLRIVWSAPAERESSLLISGDSFQAREGRRGD